MIKVKTSSPTFQISFLLGSFFVLNLIISYSQGIWLDEAFTLKTSSNPVSSWERALTFENQPPLYYGLLSVWRLLNTSYFFARLFSIVCASASVYIFYRIAKKTIHTYNPAFITLIYALNPFVIWAALEIRVYALVLLISGLIIYFFTGTYLSGEPAKSYRKRLRFSVLAVAAVYTQYYLAFLLLANFIYLLISKKKLHAKQYLVDMVLPVVSLAVFIPFIADQFTHQYSDDGQAMIFVEQLAYLLKIFLNFAFPPAGREYLDVLRKMVLFAFILSASVSAIRNYKMIVRSFFTEKDYFFWLSLILLFIYLVLLIGIVDPSNLARRHLLAAMIPLLFVLVGIFRFSGNSWTKNTWIYGLILYSVINIGFYTRKFKGKAYLDSVDYILKNEKANEPLVFYRADLSILYSIIYKGPNILVPMPMARNYDSIDNWAPIRISNAAIIEDFMKENKIGDAFWYISSEIDSGMNNSYLEVRKWDFNYPVVNAYLNAHFDIESVKLFAPHVMVSKMKRKEQF